LKAPARLNLRPRPFNAIKAGSKKVEVRANKPSVRALRESETLIFVNTETHEQLSCIIERMTLYPSVRALLLAEGTSETLSSTNDLEEGIRSIESIGDYKKIIAENGVFAIRVKGAVPFLPR